MANILVIGGGGREHAICWKLSHSDQISKIFVLPGSVGIATLNKVEIVSNVPLRDGFKVRKSLKFLSESLPILIRST